MSNYLTKEEIRSSVAYRWRKNHVKHTLTVFLVMIGVALLAMLLSAIADGDMEYIEFSLVCGLIVIAFCSAMLLPYVLFLCYKLIYITKHYSEFDCIEVALDSFSTSTCTKNPSTIPLRSPIEDMQGGLIQIHAFRTVRSRNLR